MNEPVRRITSASVDQIAAANHPLRRRLLELLALDGPATASKLAAATDQLVGNISHHLKMLAKAAMIEEAPELAKNHRERWWRAVPVSLSWSLADVRGDAAGETIATAAEHYNLGHHVEKVQDWFQARYTYDERWVRAAFSTESWVRATPEELDELGARIQAVLEDFKSAQEGDDPSREHVFVFAHGVPSRP